MFHNVIIQKFVLPVVLLNSEFYYNFFSFFFVIIFFLPLLQGMPLHVKTLTSKLVLLISLFDSLFGYLLNFLTMFDIYKMLMNYTLRFVLLISFIVYFISAQECTASLSFRYAA